MLKIHSYDFIIFLLTHLIFQLFFIDWLKYLHTYYYILCCVITMDLGANIIMVVSKYIIDINFNQYRKSILPLKSKTKRLQVGQTLIFFIRAGYDFFSLYVTWIEDTSFIFSLLALIIARARESDRSSFLTVLKRFEMVKISPRIVGLGSNA